MVVCRLMQPCKFTIVLLASTVRCTYGVCDVGVSGCGMKNRSYEPINDAMQVAHFFKTLSLPVERDGIT